MQGQPLKILTFGEEILARQAISIAEIDDRIRCLVSDMTRTMYEAPGVGLAAPQVGEAIQLVVADPSSGETPSDFLVLINPRIVEREGSESGEEGCLSVPGFTLPVDRSLRILIQALDLDGKEFRREFEGYRARVMQHEIDHLDGLLIIDRVSPLKRSLVKREIRKLKKSGKW